MSETALKMPSSSKNPQKLVLGVLAATGPKEARCTKGVY